MSIILTTAHADPSLYEGAVKAAPDKYRVVERNRATRQQVAVHERFGDKKQARQYAAGITSQRAAEFGPGASHELVVVKKDVVWGRNPVRRWSR